MKLLILCTQWGSQHLPLEDFFMKVKEAGYDGIDTWVPDDVNEKKKFISLLDKHQLKIVSHQYQAKGNTIDEYCKSMEYYLNLSMECNPLLINSHSGRDYFSLDEQLKVIDTMEEFSVKHNIVVAHETHRGHIGYSPYNAMELFNQRPAMKITADFSHWTCVTESWLEHSPEIMDEAIKRTSHLHARVGFTEGPQIGDPRLEYWKDAVTIFESWWDKIIAHHNSIDTNTFTITPEFGPPPYMWVVDEKPVASQWDINLYIKKRLEEKYAFNRK